MRCQGWPERDSSWRLAREPHHHGRPLQVLQRAEHHLAAGRGRRAVVVVAVDEHQRRLIVRDVA